MNMYEYPPGLMRPAVKARIQTALTAIILGCIVVALLAIGYQAFGPGRDVRTHALQVLQHELTLLPTYPGSQVVQSQVRSAPTDVPAIQTLYSLDGTCQDLQHYYLNEATSNSWMVYSPLRTLTEDANPDHDALHSEYRKTTQGLTIQLSLDCFFDQTYSSGYYLDITQA